MTTGWQNVESRRAEFLVCPDCRKPLGATTGGLLCRACHKTYPVRDGIADFMGDRYYDNFEPGQALSQQHAAGLRDEISGTRSRIDDYYLALIERFRRRRGRPGRGLRILDCGCGNGEAVRRLCELRFDAWGADPSALRKWQWRELDVRDRLVVADGSKLPFPNAFFDITLSSGVLEHVGVAEFMGETYSVTPLPDRDLARRRFLAEMLRVTDPSGLLWLDFPNGSFPIDFWQGGRPGAMRFHARNEGFLPSRAEVRDYVASLDPSARVRVLSPYRRFQFQQVGRFWYGRLLRVPVKLLFLAMRLPILNLLAASPLNPYVVLEIRQANMSANPVGR